MPEAPSSAGKRVNELIIKQRLSPEEATRQVLGSIRDQFALPQGATIISEGLNDLVYRDAQGYTHRIQRNGDANSPDFGRTKELSTDRPDVLPLTEQIPGLSGALQGAIQSVNATLTGGLKPLSPEDMALLESISRSEREQLSQQATRTQGELITSLYGSGTERSTVANQAAADFAQALTLALGQQQSGAARRQLDLQQFQSGLTTEAGLNLIGQLTGQETSRAIEGGRLGLGRDQLSQQATDAARNFMLEWEKFQLEKNKSPLGGILTGIASLASAFIPGIGPAISGIIGKIGSGASAPAGSPTFRSPIPSK